ncbi:hypothetical protein Tco_0067450 [Tanacetum coccineum]
MTRRQSAPDAADDLWVERVILINDVPWVGGGGVSRMSPSEESSVDDRNGKVVGSGGIRSSDESSDGSDSVLDMGGVTVGVVSRMVVRIVPIKITHPADVPTLSFDESDETEITKIAMTCTRGESDQCKQRGKEEDQYDLPMRVKEGLVLC